MKLVITALARRDLRSISQYTLNNWGPEQLGAYVGGLLDKIDHIAAQPAQGRTVPRIPIRFRRVTYKSHFIFFTFDGEDVRIIRILHQSMDHARHIN